MSPDAMNANPIGKAPVNVCANDFYPRYLAAKKSIDDRALNPQVGETLHRALEQPAGRQRLHILEIGAGIGTMLVRLLERGWIVGPAVYTATDIDPAQLRAARPYLTQWARSQGHTLSWSADGQGRLHTADADLSIVLVPAGAHELADRSDIPGAFHLLVAHAVLDLVDFPSVLPRLLQRLAPKGLAYFSGNFDGETVFWPQCDLDQEIIRRYHASMEARLAGASHTGRRLLSFLQQQDLAILAAGRSDWVIHPRQDGYTQDERFFLQAIIATVEKELVHGNNPPAGLAAWARMRRRQMQQAELSFLAGNLDILVYREAPRS